jgi:TM2 domain-containing membrane protein YozV
MTQHQNPSQGITLILASLFGVFGADKFYLGLTSQGIITLVLSLTVIGLFISIPWVYLSCIFLVISILWNGKPMLYPDNIKWAPLTQTDKIIAWTFFGLAVLGIIISTIFPPNTKKENYKYIDKKDKKKKIKN